MNKKMPSKTYIKENKAFGMWKDRLDIKNKTSDEWLKEQRIRRIKDLYRRIPSRYKNS